MKYDYKLHDQKLEVTKDSIYFKNIREILLASVDYEAGL
jgi:hypothetical protein